MDGNNFWMTIALGLLGTIVGYAISNHVHDYKPPGYDINKDYAVASIDE